MQRLRSCRPGFWLAGQRMRPTSRRCAGVRTLWATSGRTATSPASRSCGTSGGFFGQALLEQTGCSITRNESNAWPALMLRERPSAPFSRAKHALLEVFLRYGAADRAHWDYRPPGPRARDRTDEDRQCARRLEQLLRHAAKTRKFLTIRELLTLAGCWHAFRHRRAAFRETDALIQELARRPKVGGRREPRG